MNIKLSDEMSRYVRDKVRSDEYQDESQVIADALEAMRDDDEWTPEYEAYVRRAIEAAEEDVRLGRVGPLDIDALIAEERIRHLAGAKPSSGDQP